MLPASPGVCSSAAFCVCLGPAACLGLDNSSGRRPLGSAVVQIPEKSGLPSAIRGDGADRPSGRTPAQVALTEWDSLLVDEQRVRVDVAAQSCDLTALPGVAKFLSLSFEQCGYRIRLVSLRVAIHVSAAAGEEYVRIKEPIDRRLILAVAGQGKLIRLRPKQGRDWIVCGHRRVCRDKTGCR